MRLLEEENAKRERRQRKEAEEKLKEEKKKYDMRLSNYKAIFTVEQEEKRDELVLVSVDNHSEVEELDDFCHEKAISKLLCTIQMPMRNLVRVLDAIANTGLDIEQRNKNLVNHTGQACINDLPKESYGEVMVKFVKVLHAIADYDGADVINNPYYHESHRPRNEYSVHQNSYNVNIRSNVTGSLYSGYYPTNLSYENVEYVRGHWRKRNGQWEYVRPHTRRR